jgi:peroxiredoxin family protein
LADKMTLIVFSGTVDKLTAAATIASGGIAMGMEVELFFTYWGLNALRKDAIETNARFTKDFEEMGPAMAQMMKAKKVPPWYELLASAKESGSLKVHACSQTYDLMGMKKEDLSELVDDVLGVAMFVDAASDAKVSLFI